MSNRRATTKNEIAFFLLQRAVVNDLRILIKKRIIPHIQDEPGNASQLIRSKRSLEMALRTYRKKCDNPSEVDLSNFEQTKISDLKLFVDCTSFLDAFKIPLTKNFRNYIPALVRIYLKKYIDEVKDAYDIRSDAAHERYIEPGDVKFMINFCSESPLEYFEKTHKELEDIDQQVQSFISSEADWDEGFSGHNIPYPPEHESTGLLGRDKDVAEITETLSGRTNVVSIIGAAGVGKTAIAQEVAINFVKRRDIFDLILWHSFKDHSLTVKGIEEIENLKTIDSIVYENMDEIDDFNEDLSQYGEYEKMDFFEWIDSRKTLIILDNLETIHGEKTMEFIYELQKYTKLIITTRFRSNMLGIPHNINKFNEHSSLELFRAYSKYMNIEKIYKQDNQTLIKWSKNLDYNPLWIKSFCNLVLNGNDPNYILSDVVRKTDFADYSYNRNFEVLDHEEINILKIIYNSMIAEYLDKQTILSIYRKVYYNNLSPMELNEHLENLKAHNFLDWNAFQNSEITLSKFAQEWLSSKDEITSAFKEVNLAKTKFASKVQASKIASSHKPPSDWQHFATRSEEEDISAETLDGAISLLIKARKLRRKNFLAEGNYLAEITKQLEFGFEVRIVGFEHKTYPIWIQNISTELADSLVLGKQIVISLKNIEDKSGEKKERLFYQNDSLSPREAFLHEELIEDAINLASTVQEINPDYFETDRVLGLIKAYSDNHVHSAARHFQRAIDLAPEEAKNHFFYAGFLDQQLNKPELAIEEYKKAYLLDSEDITFSLMWASKMSDPEEKAKLFLEILNSAQTGNREAHKITQKIFKSFRKNVEHSEIDITPSYIIPIFENLLSGFKDKYDASYFDERSLCELLGFLKIYLELVNNGQKGGGIFDATIVLNTIESINFDMAKFKNLGGMLILLFDYISINFPEIQDDYMNLSNVGLIHPKENLMSRRKGVIKKRDENYLIFDEIGDSFSFKFWEFTDSPIHYYRDLSKLENYDVIFQPSKFKNKAGFEKDRAIDITTIRSMS